MTGSGSGASASSGCSAPSSSASSPDSYISITMSDPPTSSPSTNSCGMVGQPDRPESSSRMRGSGRMSSAAYCTPSALSAPAVRAEKPQAGWWGTPFMKSITLFSWMAFSMKLRISSLVMPGLRVSRS